MRTPLVLLLGLFTYSIGYTQTKLPFTFKSGAIPEEVYAELLTAYQTIEPGQEVVFDMLIAKEEKKLENKDKIGFSRSRCEKLAKYCKEELHIHPLLIQYQFKPTAPKSAAPAMSNKAYRSFTNRNGIYQLVLRRFDRFESTGEIDLDAVKPITLDMTQYDCDYSNTLYGSFVAVQIPEGAFDCPCQNTRVELREFFDVQDILASGLTTTSNGTLLETGGMIHLAAFCKGQPMELAKGKEVKILIYSLDEASSFQQFSGSPSHHMINWEEEGPIEPVDIRDLGEGGFEAEEDSWIMSSTQLDFINIDRFDKSELDTRLMVKLEKSDPKLLVRLVFKEQKTVLPGYAVSQKGDKVEFPQLPSNKPASILVYKKMADDKVAWAVEDLVTGQTTGLTLTSVKVTTKKEFDEQMKSLW
ncbi:hypothetical protein KFE98_14490 [bacterium SCSIO 12741]|nr:hypothetical protein KFE98_14490 [bacterium SCSIO 12741]